MTSRITDSTWTRKYIKRTDRAYQLSSNSKGKLDYRIIISNRNLSLERGRIRLRNGPRGVLLAKALFEVLKLLKLMKKVDARMDYYLRTRLEPWNYRNITDRVFSCLPTMVTCLNMFPSKNGTSSYLIPVSITLGSSNPEYNKLKLTFGAHAQVYIGTTNRTKQKTVGAISLHTANEQGGHYFMSIATEKHIHA